MISPHPILKSTVFQICKNKHSGNKIKPGKGEKNKSKKIKIILTFFKKILSSKITLYCHLEEGKHYCAPCLLTVLIQLCQCPGKLMADYWDSFILLCLSTY